MDFIIHFNYALNVASPKNGVDLVEFYKSEKTSGQTVHKNSSAFVSYHGRLDFRLFCSFNDVLGISIPKMKSLH